MALRMMIYQTRIWEHHRTADPTTASTGPLPLIIPIVIYQGPRRWTAATDIAGLPSTPTQNSKPTRVTSCRVCATSSMT